MARAGQDRNLSELEGCVLGHLWKHGAGTAYGVRLAFLRSPSSHWSGSAGAVYPVIERLEARGLVASEHAPRGGRDAWRYAITARGRARFRTWLGPPFDDGVTSVPPDPLRTRLHFLGAMTPRRRARFVAAAIAGLRGQLAALESTPADDADDRRALVAARAVMRARISSFERLRRP